MNVPTARQRGVSPMDIGAAGVLVGDAWLEENICHLRAAHPTEFDRKPFLGLTEYFPFFMLVF